MSLIDFLSNTNARRTAPRTQSQVAGSGVTTCRGGGGGGGGGGGRRKGEGPANTTADMFCVTATDTELPLGAGLALAVTQHSNKMARAVRMSPTNGLVDTIVPWGGSTRSLASNSITVNTL